MPPQATLLVVDDNPDNRDFLSRRLIKRGYDVRAVDGGEAALFEVAQGGVDLVLLDIMMPEMDGLEVLRRLRLEHDQAALPVIMVTAKSEATDVVRALDLGANDYITKPISFPVVLARVQKELRTSSAFREASRGAETPDAPPRPLPPGAATDFQQQPHLGTGVVLADRYRLGRRIGSGNFGTVYRGHHQELGLPVAIKVLQTQMGQDEESLARFRAEGRSACLVQHPHAVTVFDFGITEGGIAYMVMELLEGTSLADEFKSVGPLSPTRLSAIVPPVAAVLAAAHEKKIVHRDVKPDNIFLHGDRAEPKVKVLDFGIAKLVGDRVSEQNLTAEGFILGTPAFMAPERLRNETYDGRSDVYSLGVTLYQLLSGTLPFKPDQGDPMAVLLMHLNDEPRSLAAHAPQAPPELVRLVDRCLAKTPAERPTLDELSHAFAAYASPAGAPRPASAGSGNASAGPGAVDGEISDELPTRRLDSKKVETAAGPARLTDKLRSAWRRLVGTDAP